MTWGVDVGDKASKPVTTVQDRVSTFARVNLLDIFNISLETSEIYPAVFVVA